MKMENLAELLSQLREIEKKINKEFEKIGIRSEIKSFRFSISLGFFAAGISKIAQI